MRIIPQRLCGVVRAPMKMKVCSWLTRHPVVLRSHELAQLIDIEAYRTCGSHVLISFPGSRDPYYCFADPHGSLAERNHTKWPCRSAQAPAVKILRRSWSCSYNVRPMP